MSFPQNGQNPLGKEKDFKFYNAGYRAGWLDYQETGFRNQSSEDAWKAYIG